MPVLIIPMLVELLHKQGIARFLVVKPESMSMQWYLVVLPQKHTVQKLSTVRVLERLIRLRKQAALLHLQWKVISRKVISRIVSMPEQ